MSEQNAFASADGRGDHSSPAGPLVVRHIPGTLALDVPLPANDPMEVDETPDFKVVVTVARGEQFVLSAKLVTQYSNFFDCSLTSHWKSKQKKAKINLEVTDPNIFEIFADWLNHGSVFTREGRTPASLTYTSLCHAYVLGQDLCAQKFRNDIMDIITAKFDAGHPPDKEVPKIAYVYTPPNSPLRRILVDVYAYRGGPDFVRGSAKKDIDEEFLIDLTCALYSLRAKDTPYPYHLANVGCRYHDHGILGDSACPGATLPAMDNRPSQDEVAGVNETEGLRSEPPAQAMSHSHEGLPSYQPTAPVGIDQEDFQLAMERSNPLLTPSNTRVGVSDVANDSGIGSMSTGPSTSTNKAAPKPFTPSRKRVREQTIRDLSDITPCPAPRDAGAGGAGSEIKEEPVGEMTMNMMAPDVDNDVSALTGQKMSSRRRTKVQKLRSRAATRDEPIELD
ncbi:hypothetical protein CAC42_2226 [Sphaceloma murrayae]|uniref:BTB domain-containing protein n=1 Tax=Sphaceloma murrayae TaxID=2082308 RepID=A0A2K1QIN6_9PEZI|nr:hypothetical protein CAC42_2226 [Sphaceloma murrayae]